MCNAARLPGMGTNAIEAKIARTTNVGELLREDDSLLRQVHFLAKPGMLASLTLTMLGDLAQRSTWTLLHFQHCHSVYTYSLLLRRVESEEMHFRPF